MGKNKRAGAAYCAAVIRLWNSECELVSNVSHRGREALWTGGDIPRALGLGKTKGLFCLKTLFKAFIGKKNAGGIWRWEKISRPELGNCYQVQLHRKCVIYTYHVYMYAYIRSRMAKLIALQRGSESGWIGSSLTQSSPPAPRYSRQSCKCTWHILGQTDKIDKNTTVG